MFLLVQGQEYGDRFNFVVRRVRGHVWYGYTRRVGSVFHVSQQADYGRVVLEVSIGVIRGVVLFNHVKAGFSWLQGVVWSWRPASGCIRVTTS